MTNIILDSDEFRFRAVTTVEGRKIIQSCPLNKAPGNDKLHIISLPVILLFLTELINGSLLASVFPTWKESEVVP